MPSPSPLVPAKKRWTVLVYLAGDNDLDSAAVGDLAEMKKVGSSPDVNVVAQLDRAGAGHETRRYLVRKGTPLAKDAVESLGETNCGDPAVLQDFVAWGAARYPAEHTLLVVWNHGAGWDDANLYRGDAFGRAPPPVVRKGRIVRGGRGAGRAVPLRQVRAALRRTGRALFRTTPVLAARKRAIAFDDDAQDFLDNVELKRVLANATRAAGRKLDVLGLDACLMSMVEVAYQLRGGADLLVGSQETEPGDGWPYDRILGALVARPEMTPEELARAIVERYLASYRPGDGVTQSAADLGAIPAVAAAVNALGRALSAELAAPAGRAAVLEARDGAQEYSAPYDDYCDLAHLSTRLAQRTRSAAVKRACAEVRSALGACVLASGAKGAGVASSRGLSIYFPTRKLSPLYGGLDFARGGAWRPFLAAFLERRSAG